MAKDWYTITPPDRYSGYETKQFYKQAESGFDELLGTFIARTVELYSFDLTECHTIRAVVQGVVANSVLSSMSREFLVPIGTCKAGMYFKYEDCFWLITNFVDNNGMYEKALASLCQYKIRWQNKDGKIMERWCNLTAASKSDDGITGNNVIHLASTNYIVLLPNDADSMTIDGKRVFIDKNETNPVKVFQITRSDDTPYDYGIHGGILNLIADKTEFNLDTDNQELRICNYRKPFTLPPVTEIPDESIAYSASILGNHIIKVGFPRTYTVQFTDENGTRIDCTEVDFTWNIVSAFDVGQTVHSDSITLSVKEEALIGSSFSLQVVLNDQVMKEIEITVAVGW